MTDARLSTQVAQVAVTAVGADARLSTQVAQVAMVLDGIAARLSTQVIQVALNPSAGPVHVVDFAGNPVQVWSGGSRYPVAVFDGGG